MGIEQWKAAWEFFRFSNHAETSRSEQIGQIGASLAVDGDAEMRQAHAPGFKDGHSRVFNAIAGIVKVEIIRLAVAHAANVAFGGTGQKCTAASRLIVHRKVLDAFTERLVNVAQALRVGHALAEDTQIGPVVSEGQLAANLGWSAAQYSSVRLQVESIAASRTDFSRNRSCKAWPMRDGSNATCSRTASGAV